jgi:hypothetical protein
MSIVKCKAIARSFKHVSYVLGFELGPKMVDNRPI